MLVYIRTENDMSVGIFAPRTLLLGSSDNKTNTRPPAAPSSFASLDDANLVRDVEGVIVGGQPHVRLLQAVGPESMQQEDTRQGKPERGRIPQRCRAVLSEHPATTAAAAAARQPSCRRRRRKLVPSVHPPSRCVPAVPARAIAAAAVACSGAAASSCSGGSCSSSSSRCSSGAARTG